MVSTGRSRVLVVAVVLILVGAGFIAYQSYFSSQGCHPSSSTSGRYQSGRIHFGAVTEYCLASPERWVNGIAGGPDGSVWFGEQAVPGVAELFPNGTVAEHAWPNANGSTQTINGYQTGIWGVAFWRGMVWGANMVGNSIVGYNPNDGSFRTLALPLKESQPYTLTVGPDGAMWFTSLGHSPTLGRVSPNFTVSMDPVFANRDELPTEIQFASSSLGYYTALDPYNGARSGLYSFNPGNVSGGVRPTQVTGNFSIIYANSLSISSTTIWVEQHLVSAIGGYNLLSGAWTVYPTSTVKWANTALPYFVRASGATVWFNEHYANRIAALNPMSGTLTEYSEADPPVTTQGGVQNDLTITASPAGAWFTSTTGNYVGFVDGSYAPSFSLSANGQKDLALSPGGSEFVQLRLTGTWSKSLNVSTSDTENFNASATLISIQPDKTSIPAGSGPITLGVEISAKATLQPGRYTVGVTVSDGLVIQTAYLFVIVA